MVKKCFYCQDTEVTIAHIKACADLKAHQADNAKVTAVFTKIAETAKPVEVVVPATVQVKAVPAHRVKKNLMFSSAGTTTQEKQEFLDKMMKKANKALVTIEAPAATPVVLTEIKKGQDLELGMYQVDGEIYKVKFNKAGTQKYAEKLLITEKKDWSVVDGEWVATKTPKGKFLYAYGMMAKLTSENKMSEAQAKEFHDATKLKYGVDYGFCCVCAKLLTVKKSIAAGIGPVCAGKL